jgi:hypothetical protein
VLTIEVSWAQTSTCFSLDLAVVRALENAFKGDLRRIVYVTKAFISLKGWLPFSSAFASCSSRLNALSVQKPSPSDVDGMLQMIRSPGSVGDGGAFIASSGHDVVGAGRWFATMDSDVVSGHLPLAKLFSDLEIEFNALANELRCLRSWNSFAQMSLFLVKKWRRDAPESTQFGMSPSAFLQSMTMQILRSLRTNLDLIERGQMEASCSVLTQEGLSMARTTSGLLLTHLCAEDLLFLTSSDNWVEAIGLIAEIAVKLSRYPLVESTVRVVSNVATVTPSDWDSLLAAVFSLSDRFQNDGPSAIMCSNPCQLESWERFVFKSRV